MRRRVRDCASATEAEDWTQDLLLHLAALPSTSKHRKDGKEDVIQTFAPERMHGANEARFRSFINWCLGNRHCTLYSKWRKRPLSNPRNLSFEVDGEFGASDEFCHSNSEYLRQARCRSREQEEQRFRLEEFVSHAEFNIAGLRQFLGVFVETECWSETKGRLDLADYSFTRERIRQFGRRCKK